MRARFRASWWSTGYVRGAANDFEPAPSYAAGVAAYQAKVRAKVSEALARLSPPMSLTGLAHLVQTGELSPELIGLGQDGAINLAVRGELRSDGAWVTDPALYDKRVAQSSFVTDPSFGVMTDRPVQRTELQAFIKGVGAADFKTLTTDPVRSLYGQKTLAVPALVDMLMGELGLRELVIVPQETTTGQILAALAKSTINGR